MLLIYAYVQRPTEQLGPKTGVALLYMGKANKWRLVVAGYVIECYSDSGSTIVCYANRYLWGEAERAICRYVRNRSVRWSGLKGLVRQNLCKKPGACLFLTPVGGCISSHSHTLIIKTDPTQHPEIDCVYEPNK